MLDSIRKATSEADVVMSVCTGAFALADAGVLNGKPATTHHSAYTELQRQFPAILVQHAVRCVQSDPIISTAAGLSAGIDLALHIVDRYVGREIAQTTAKNMEYEGQGWKTGKTESEK